MGKLERLEWDHEDTETSRVSVKTLCFRRPDGIFWLPLARGSVKAKLETGKPVLGYETSLSGLRSRAVWARMDETCKKTFLLGTKWEKVGRTI